MASIIRKIAQILKLRPQTTTIVAEKGEVQVLDSSGKILYHDGSAVRTVVDQNSTETLTNKSISADANTVTNIKNAEIKAGAAIALNKLAATTVSRALVSDASGFITASTVTATQLGYLSTTTSDVQDQLNNKLVAINYLNYNNSTAEASTGNWVAYADAAGAAPVDGTGGSPVLTVTRSTSSPLRGIASLLLTKDAANRQGNGASVDFTIDSADQAKVLNFTFDYSASANFAYGDGTVASPSDIVMYIYDVTNAAIIQPVNILLNGSGQGITQFQTASNSTSYRAILHVATTNALAWTFKLDNIVIGPSILARGPIVTDWVSYTPTVSGFSLVNGTVTAKSRRVGDSIQIQGTYTFGSSSSFSSTFAIGFPAGITAVQIPNNLGTDAAHFFDDSGADWVGVSYVNSGGTSMSFRVNGSGSSVGNTIPFTWANLDRLDFNITAKVVGWSSNVVTSSDSGLRLVAFEGSNTASTAITTTTVPMTSIKDTVGGWSTNQYTVKESGFYNISYGLTTASVNLSASQRFLASIKVNGSNKFEGTASWGNGSSHFQTSYGSATVYLNVNDVITLVADTSVAVNLSNSVGDCFLTITKVSSPQTIGMTDSVGCMYTSSTTATGTSRTIMIQPTKVFDTHNAYNSSTGIYTFPVGGMYAIVGGFAAASTATGSVNASGLLRASVNTSTDYDMGNFILQTTGSVAWKMNGQTIIKVNAGDTVSLTINRSSLTGTPTADGSTSNFLSIARIG